MGVMDPSRRWTLPDLASALAWVAERNGQGIRCTLALAGEYAETISRAREGAEENIACIREIAQAGAGTSLSVKPSALGSLFDQAACRELIIRIAREAALSHVPLELDMEGKGSVDLTLALAAECRRVYSPVTVALQAYLHRTREDLPRMVSLGVGIRLVKGAYLGDVTDGARIRELMEEYAGALEELRAPFSLGTHDPILIHRIMERFEGRRGLVEFGFLKGLSDETKLRLAADGWRVSEYVPFGPGGEAYVLRRERYLRDLARSGLAPAP
jgi:proline dehydrogenase